MKKKIALFLLTIIFLAGIIVAIPLNPQALQQTYYVTLGGTINITGSNYGDNSSWKSDNNALVVTADGNNAILWAKSTYTNSIKVTHSNNQRSESCNVKIIDNISLNKTNINLSVGGTQTLEVTGLDTSHSDQITAFYSSDTSVATVSASNSIGTIEAKGGGETTIIVKTKFGGYATCKVSVPGVALNKTSIQKFVGESATIRAKLYGDEVIATEGECYSDETDVVEISRIGETDEFKLEFKTVGTTNIHVKTANNLIATCQVEVINALDKTAKWLEEGKEAEIEISTHRSNVETIDHPRVLFLGSLCSAHDLKGSTVKNAINAIAQKATVDYRLFGMNVSLKYADDPVEGTLEYGNHLDNDFALRSGYHSSGLYFADVINTLGDDIDKYDLIVMEFDGLRTGFVWGENGTNESVKTRKELLTRLQECYKHSAYNAKYGDGPITDPDANNLDEVEDYFAQASLKLKEFYDNNKVVWLVPEKKEAYEAGITIGAYYMYDDKYIVDRKTYDFCRMYAYDTMALLAPEDWLAKDDSGNYIAKKRLGVIDSKYVSTYDFSKNSYDSKKTYIKFFDEECKKYVERCKEKQYSDANTSGMWTVYGNASIVQNMLETKSSEIADITRLELSDVITSGFTVKSVSGYKNGSSTPIATYKPGDKQSGDFKVDFDTDDNGNEKIVGTFKFRTDDSQDVKMKIVITPKDTMIRNGINSYLVLGKDGKYKIKTNEGSARADYYNGTNTLVSSNTVETPLLDEPRLRVTKELEAGTPTEDRMPGDTINYIINIENVGTEEITEIKLIDALAGYTKATSITKFQTSEETDITRESLASGANVTIIIPYEIKAADVVDGKIQNSVSVTGKVGGEEVTATDVTGKDLNNEIHIKPGENIPVRYVVHYYLNGTTTRLTDDTTGLSTYGQSLETTAKIIEGYTVVGDSSKTIETLALEDNIIKYYYYQNITVSGKDVIKQYDGYTHKSEGYDVEDKDNNLLYDIKFSDPVETTSDLVVTTGEKKYVGNYVALIPKELVGKTDKTNTYYVTAVKNGSLKITPPETDYFIQKTHEDGKYDEGDEIEFTITVMNVYDRDRTIKIEELPGVTLEQDIFEKVPSGESITAKAKYTVVEEDKETGKYKNTAKISFSDIDETFTVEDLVNTIVKKNPITADFNHLLIYWLLALAAVVVMEIVVYTEKKKK